MSYTIDMYNVCCLYSFEMLGKCQCTAGYKGRDCEVPCERGRYGIGCAYRCDCEHANSEGCDHVTGKCICNSGWRGKTYKTILMYNVFSLDIYCIVATRAT